MLASVLFFPPLLRQAEVAIPASAVGSSVEAPMARAMLERQVAGTDQQIDQLVYELYGLTAEEISIVEGQGT
jgi:hypothetical protein